MYAAGSITCWCVTYRGCDCSCCVGGWGACRDAFWSIYAAGYGSAGGTSVISETLAMFLLAVSSAEGFTDPKLLSLVSFFSLFLLQQILQQQQHRNMQQRRRIPADPPAAIPMIAPRDKKP